MSHLPFGARKKSEEFAENPSEYRTSSAGTIPLQTVRRGGTKACSLLQWLDPTGMSWTGMTFSGPVAQGVDGSSQKEVYSEEGASSGSRLFLSEWGIWGGKIITFPTRRLNCHVGFGSLPSGKWPIECLELKGPWGKRIPRIPNVPSTFPFCLFPWIFSRGITILSVLPFCALNSMAHSL